MNEKLKAFVLMPFDPEFTAVYTTVIKKSLEDIGYEVSRADSFLDQQNILRSIIRGIMSADLIVADLTTANANVFYELGLCHGLRIPTILLAQSMGEVPFDLRSYKVQIYDTHFDRIEKLKKSLQSIGEKHKENGVVFGSPIIDFTEEPKDNPDIRKNATDKVTDAEEDPEQQGLLDYLVGGEEAASALTRVLQQFSMGTESIATKLNKHTTNMNALSTNPRPGTAAQFHKISLLAAADIQGFSKDIEDTLPEFELAIDQLDENYSGWINLANPQTEKDKEQMKSLHSTITTLLTASRTANQSTSSFRDSAIQLREMRISKELSRATKRQAVALSGIISNMQRVEAFCLKTLEVLDEKFG